MTEKYTKKLVSHAKQLAEYSQNIRFDKHVHSPLTEKEQKEIESWQLFMHKLNLLIGFITALEYMEPEEIITGEPINLEQRKPPKFERANIQP